MASGAESSVQCHSVANRSESSARLRTFKRPDTGEILHAHIFILPGSLKHGDLDEQNDHLRYVVAHEVGHALGLRHNFAKGPVSTVMNYF